MYSADRYGKGDRRRPVRMARRLAAPSRQSPDFVPMPIDTALSVDQVSERTKVETSLSVECVLSAASSRGTVAPEATTSSELSLNDT